MKKVFIFASGFIAGIISTILVLALIAAKNQPNDGVLGLTLFPEKGECIPIKGEIEVFQVLEPNIALAEAGEFPDEFMVLLVNYEGKHYYDDQKFKITTRKCARQIGTFKYTNKGGLNKTVPAVVVEEK